MTTRATTTIIPPSISSRGNEASKYEQRRFQTETDAGSQPWQKASSRDEQRKNSITSFVWFWLRYTSYEGIQSGVLVSQHSHIAGYIVISLAARERERAREVVVTYIPPCASGGTWWNSFCVVIPLCHIAIGGQCSTHTEGPGLGQNINQSSCHEMVQKNATLGKILTCALSLWRRSVFWLMFFFFFCIRLTNGMTN